ncbi:hypothetical protein ColLi_05646 [Colletotrichum liriopes]|uniref:Uncharacterized protein n=1 Tax=Colletotrichum liriopes TaxID=708192 RepID=A0AA37GMA9_9PEZI|nr:hypothetical protein ColLi_05646 [Colletotrichum liriopes]
MGKAAVERKMLGEVARHINSRHTSCPGTACRANGTARPADGVVIKIAHRDQRTGTGTGMGARGSDSDVVGPGPGPGGHRSDTWEQETPEPVRKTAAHYCALFAVVSASALAGYLVRCAEAGTTPSESGGPEKMGEGDGRRGRGLRRDAEAALPRRGIDIVPVALNMQNTGHDTRSSIHI